MGLICWLFGHKYKIVKKFGPQDRKMKCDRCGALFGVNDRMLCIVPWDSELEEVYSDFG